MMILQGCFNQSDEQVLREEFDIPGSAITILIESFPEEGGWFGREGLKINAVFKFSDADFKDYKDKAESETGWRALPPPKEFLMKMGGIKSHKEGMLRVYKELREPVPEEGSVYNPTEDQLYERFVSQLPLDASRGLYQCRTAGNSIMHYPKRIVIEPEKDLNDFMFAVLDYDKKELAIRVSTNY
jgi:hypothetical protein